jgi:hypothetical protein
VSGEALMIERGMIAQDGKCAHAGMVARPAPEIGNRSLDPQVGEGKSS